MGWILKSTAVALATANLIFAQQCGQSGATTTISSTAAASSIASCTTYSGSIAIASSLPENSTINLNVIEVIAGSLIAKDVPGLVRLSSEYTTRIEGSVELSNCPNLAWLDLDGLTYADGLLWENLPSLETIYVYPSKLDLRNLRFDATPLSGATFSILTSLETLVIINNPSFGSLNLSALQHVTESVIVDNNDPTLAVALPNMTSTSDFIVRDVGELTLPVLSSVNGNFEIANTSILELSLPMLVNVASNLTVKDNSRLITVTSPELAGVNGTFIVSNNTAYSSISFPRLATVDDAMDIDGAFTSSNVPALRHVRGTLTIDSTANIDQICDIIADQTAEDMDVQGVFRCQGEVKSTGSETADPEPTPELTPEPTSGPNVGAIAGGVVGGVAGLAIIAAGVFLIIRRKVTRKQPQQPELQTQMVYGSPIERAS